MRLDRRSLAALLAMFALSSAANAQTVQVPGPTVTTTGTASVFVAPDKVELRFAVSDFDTDLAIAKRTSDESAARIIEFLRDQGVAATDIQTAQISSQAIYDDRWEEGRRVRGNLKGYEVYRGYGVTIKDIAKFAAVIDRLLTDKNVRVEGYSYSTAEDRKFRDQARQDAARAAREKADLLAATLGARVTGVRTINESSPPQVFALNMMANSVRDGGGGANASEAATPVGQIEIKAEITASFDIVPNG